MTEWKTIGYLREGESKSYKFELTLPTPLADWDVWDYWERARVHSMEHYLTDKDVLFDVGAETGWLSAVYAKLCKNIFLIEPTKEFWPNIRQIAARNGYMPVGCYAGLLGSKRTNELPEIYKFRQWPKESEGQLIDKNKYQYLHEHTDDIPQISLDDLVRASNIEPTAITIDVEGAELEVLIGAYETIKKCRPKIWVSVHPDLMLKNYNQDMKMLLQWIKSMYYDAEFLGSDHEEHWLFLPDKL